MTLIGDSEYIHTTVQHRMAQWTHNQALQCSCTTWNLYQW